MIGIEITNVLGTFMIEKVSALSVQEFKLEILSLDDSIVVEVTNVALETVYLQRDLLMQSVFKNITI